MIKSNGLMHESLHSLNPNKRTLHQKSFSLLLSRNSRRSGLSCQLPKVRSPLQGLLNLLQRSREINMIRCVLTVAKGKIWLSFKHSVCKSGFTTALMPWSPMRGLAAYLRSHRSQKCFRHGKHITHWHTKANGNRMSTRNGNVIRRNGRPSTQTRNPQRPGSKSWTRSWRQNLRARPKGSRIVAKNTERTSEKKERRFRGILNLPETASSKCKFRPRTTKNRKLTSCILSVIDKLPKTLASWGKAIMDQTGWHVTVLVGRPCPDNNGRLMTYLWVKSLSYWGLEP